MVDRLLSAGFGVAARAFSNLAGADFGEPVVDPAPFGPGPVIAGGGFGAGPSVGGAPFGPPPQLNAEPFGGDHLWLETEPFGPPPTMQDNLFGGAYGAGGGFGPPPIVSSDPFASIPIATDTKPTTATPGAPGARGGANWAGPATSDDNKTLTAAQIDQWIVATRADSPLAGMGAYILDAANRRGVSAVLMLGIMLKESELGTTAGPNMNLGGVTDPSRDQGLGGQRAFASNNSWAQAIDGIADNLATDMYRGKSLQEQVGNWYVGPQEYAARGLAATDRAGNGTVADYLGIVSQVYQALGVGIDPAATGTATGTTYADPTGLLAAAQPLIGNPYQLGGRRANGRVGPGIGIDCSEFTAYLYEQQGVTLTWNAQAQYDSTQRVAQGQWQPGDLIFFTQTYDAGGATVTHVGMFVGYDSQGNPIMVHSGSGGVGYANLNEQYYRDHYYGAGRVMR